MLLRLDKEQKSYARFSKFTRRIFGNACRITHLKESIENWSTDGVTNLMQTFWDNSWSWSYNKNVNHVCNQDS